MATNSDRRCAIGIVVLAAVALLASPATAQQTNPEATYFVQGEKYPRGLRDFQAFGLFRKAAGRGTAPYSGWVMGDRGDPDGTTVDMKVVQVNGRKLSFTTKVRNGIVFAFDGRFLQSGDFRRFDGKGVAVVEGVVRKLRGGKKLAEGRMRFTSGGGGG